MPSRIFLLFGLALTMTAHAAPAVIVGTVRPSISPGDVKVYLHAPERYEKVAILDVKSEQPTASSFEGKSTIAIQRLKEQAAKFGANGVFIQGAGDRYTGSLNPSISAATGTGNNPTGTGFGTSSGVKENVGTGVAIYVIQD